MASSTVIKSLQSFSTFFHRNMLSDFDILDKDPLHWHIKGKKRNLRVKCIQKESDEMDGSTNKSISKASLRWIIFPNRKGQLRILLSFWPRECHRGTKKQNETHLQRNGSQYFQRTDVKIKLDFFQKPNFTWFLFTQHYDCFQTKSGAVAVEGDQGSVLQKIFL